MASGSSNRCGIFMGEKFRVPDDLGSGPRRLGWLDWGNKGSWAIQMGNVQLESHIRQTPPFER